MTTVHNIEGTITAYVKGALDELLSVCDTVLTTTGIEPLTTVYKEKYLV